LDRELLAERVPPDDREPPDEPPDDREPPDEPVARDDREPPDEPVEPDDRELPAERELFAVLEAPDDRDALAVLLFEVFALWARARVDFGLRCAAFAGLDDERLEVSLRLGEPRSLTADISTPPIRFPALGAFRNFTGAGLLQGLPVAICPRTT
jgi:hypothetical protein